MEHRAPCSWNQIISCFGRRRTLRVTINVITWTLTLIVIILSCIQLSDEGGFSSITMSSFCKTTIMSSLSPFSFKCGTTRFTCGWSDVNTILRLCILFILLLTIMLNVFIIIVKREDLNLSRGDQTWVITYGIIKWILFGAAFMVFIITIIDIQQTRVGYTACKQGFQIEDGSGDSVHLLYCAGSSTLDCTSTKFIYLILCEVGLFFFALFLYLITNNHFKYRLYGDDNNNNDNKISKLLTTKMTTNVNVDNINNTNTNSNNTSSNNNPDDNKNKNNSPAASNEIYNPFVEV